MEYGYAFVHVPKTAGNSIATLLEQLPRRGDPGRRRRMHKHTKARHLRALLGPELWGRLFRFSVVRNPWDLMVSSYLWWVERGAAVEHLRPLAEEVRALGSFREFAMSRFGGTMINECPGQMLDWLEIDGKIDVDFVARFEQLDQDWERICALSGIPFRPLPRLNASPGRLVYRDYYDDQTREIVARRFARDAAMFGYEF